MSDNCNRVGPTPAECINTEGGYECSCSQYTGYRVSADGITCEDVDECAEGSHVCSMLCVNTPGSYHCSCPEGYELDEDEVTCHDIDECERMISGCQHSCTNTVGSFVCTCDRGYLLSPDALSCEALSCDPTLEAPPNGTIDCDRQTVGGACNFTCDEGFTLRVGERRTCLPSLMWRERPAICDPPTCPELEPPLNGFVVFPCTREEGHSCDAVCAHGYRAIGSTVRTCIRDSTTDTLAWSDGPQCVVSDPCSPDPCANGGTCMRGSGDPFTCACNGTGYGGPTCEIAVIRFSPLQTNADGSSIILELSTEATLRRSSEIIIVTLRDSGGTRTAVLRLRRDTRNVRQTVPSTVGIMIVTLPKNKNEFLYEPRERRVFISSGTGNEETYFKQLSLPRGQLKPSCCAADDHVTISCPGATTMTISLVSPCQWSTNKARFTRTIGSVFAQSSDLILPTSISGLRYRNSPYQNSVRNSVGACEPCDTCANDDDDKCYCYAHTPQNTLEFLQTRALGFTYVNEIQMLLPSWLEMSVDLENIVDSSPITDLDMFAPITQANEEVSSIEGCEQLSTLMSGIFSVLRHDKTISAVIDGERYNYTERLNSGDSDTTMCFAVDMCQGLDSPVHMQISQPISDILASQFLRHFTSRQWTFVFNNVSVFKNAMPRPATRQFWNGVESIKTPDVLADVSMDIDAGLVFSDTGLAMRLEFSGTVDTNYEDKVGYLEGGVTLAVDSTIDAGEQNFQLTRSNTNAYFHISEVGDPCRAQDTDLYGVSFMASYEPQPGEQFFTRLLRFTETTQKCDFEAFIPINSDYRALGLSLHTECPLLAVDELIFPKMTHTITFIGSRAPDCLVRSFIGVSSPGLVVESELISNRLPLGNILELKASPNGPDLTTVFDRNTANGPSSRLHMVQVALFGEIFLTEANIQNNQLEISANSPVFGYPAQYTITAPSNMTDWNDLEYTLQGSLLSGFITSLSAEIVSKLRTLAQSGDARRNVAQMSLDQSMERFETIEAKLMEAEENVTRAEQERMAADAMVLTAQDRVTELETQFNSSQDELRDLMEMLDGLCQEETCEDVCMAGKVCRDCTRPNFITKTGDCPFKVQVARMVRVPPYVVVVPGSWTWVPACRFSSYLTCAGGLLCQIENRGYCSGVCTRVPRFKEHIEWRTVYDEIVENKPCTVKKFTGFVPGTCCEDMDCAVFAPSPTCITDNAMCRSRRQNAIDERENLSD
ncbi:Matrilin-2 [Geodia barretti]|nr:Matrilin-2 [Geodia barretti]